MVAKEEEEEEELCDVTMFLLCNIKIDNNGTGCSGKVTVRPVSLILMTNAR